MITVTREQEDLLTLCASRAEGKSVDWILLARTSVPTTASALTDCESITAAVGSASRPSFSRTRPHSRSWNSVISAFSRQRRKNA